MTAAEMLPEVPGSWVEVQLGITLGQCRARVPSGTDIDLPTITMPIRSHQVPPFVLTVEVAGASCLASAMLDDLDAAVTYFCETHESQDGVSNVCKAVLDDGYIFTAQNKTRVGVEAPNSYWLRCRRLLDGKAYAVETMARTAEELTMALAFSKSIRAPLASER